MGRITRTSDPSEYRNIELELKVSQGIKLTKENLEDLMEYVMDEPESGWNYEEEYEEANYIQHYKMQIGNYEYSYRINLSYKLLTLLSIKKV